MKGFQDAGKEFERVFGHKPTLEQLWWITKFAKHVRLRCRNNSAFNNFCNQQFGPDAQFRTVQKEWQGKYYDGLQIAVSGVSKDEEPEQE
jgi:hypothetical protein